MTQTGENAQVNAVRGRLQAAALYGAAAIAVASVVVLNTLPTLLLHMRPIFAVPFGALDQCVFFYMPCASVSCSACRPAYTWLLAGGIAQLVLMSALGLSLLRLRHSWSRLRRAGLCLVVTLLAVVALDFTAGQSFSAVYS